MSIYIGSISNKNILFAFIIYLFTITISCSDDKVIKEIEYNGDNENAQYIDKPSTIKGLLDNSKEEKDVDIYRLVHSNDYILSLSIKQNKNAQVHVSVSSVNGRNIFSLTRNNNIKIPLYNIKERDVFLKLESDANEKIAYTLKIDFIEDYYNEKEVEANNTFNDAINILSPNTVLEGSFVKIEHADKLPNQVITNISFDNILDVDIYRLKNPTDMNVHIDINVELDTRDKLDILLFDSRYNLISKQRSNSIPLSFGGGSVYYAVLVYYSDINEFKPYKLYYTVR